VSNPEEIAALIATAARHGLYLNPADVITEGLPDGWAIVPRHWGFSLYDYTILSPCCNGWSGGDMQRKRKTIKAARRVIGEHIAGCRRSVS
jgi:hypothetical protein